MSLKNVDEFSRLLSTFKVEFSLRFDGDVFRRCFLILFYSHLIRFVVQLLPTSLGFWAETSLIEAWTCLFLAAAVLKSAFCYASRGQAVLVTGCDSGFGFALCQRLQTQGVKVYAGVLNVESEGARKLKQLEHVRVFKLDVTSEADWDEAVEIVNSTASDLWGLVHNAGVATLGETEWTPMSTYQELLDVNLKGLILGSRKLLPLIRRSKGRVVFVSSVLSRAPLPTRGAYSITMAATEAFAEALKHEMRPFGVEVSLVTPGHFIEATKILTKDRVEVTKKQMISSMSDEVLRAYGGEDGVERRLSSHGDVGASDCRPVVDAYFNALFDVSPQFRYLAMSWKTYMKTFAFQYLPEIIYDSLYINRPSFY